MNTLTFGSCYEKGVGVNKSLSLARNLLKTLKNGTLSTLQE